MSRHRRKLLATLIVLSLGLVLNVPLALAGPGDLDGDGDVDRADLDILLLDRNKSVSDSNCGPPCDLDGDGQITGLDARKLVLLCTRPRCATEPPGEEDTTPPNLSITEPAAGSFIFQNRPNIEVSYSDNKGVDTTSLAFIANGVALDVNCQLNETGGRCTPTTPLPEGPVTLGASIADAAGNTATTQIAFTVDSVPAAVTIETPAGGLITKDQNVAVTGTVGAGVTAVQVNGVAASLSAGSFTATVPLREGTNMIVALATKANGRTGTDSIDVTRDIFAPVVRIDSPRDAFVSFNDVIAVTGMVNDIVNGAVNTQVFVNGVEATVAGGSFMVIDLPLVRGPNTIEAVATDAVGNEGRHSITVNFQQAAGGRIGIVSGNGQADQVNQPLPEPLVVEVKDEFGNPVAGRVVRFGVTRNSGLLQVNQNGPAKRVVQVPTDGSGRATALLTLGDTAGEGNNRVRATALGVAGEVEFCASAVPTGPDKVLMVMGDNQRGLVGHPLATPLEALVVDKDSNPIEGVPVTFSVVRGTGNLDGQQSLVRVTGMDGIARTVLTLGAEPGINNNIVNATFEGLAGLPATFVTSGLLPGNPADTRLSGVVLDNSHTPIPGAIVTIPGSTLSTTTDDAGQFLLEQVPVGHINLNIDPTNSPRPETFPPLEFETVTVAGQVNTIGQPILLPALATNGSRIVGGNQDVTLTMPGVPGLELTVFANSVTFPDGSTTGQLTITQVHLDKIPMPPPNGSPFMPPAWTIQPAGVVFDPPARISIPNDGLPPGRVIDIVQFDHTLNEFIKVGKGTVSDDGFVIVSDPGFGITRAGWGGCTPPDPLRTCGDFCDDGEFCNGEEKCVGNVCEKGVKKADGTKSGGNCCFEGMTIPNSPIARVSACPNRVANGELPIVNGCSVVSNDPNQTCSQFGPFEAPSFRNACNFHDACYDECGRPRVGCDQDFAEILLATCTSVSVGGCRELCNNNARTYARGVTGIISGGRYDQAQKRVCNCCQK